MSRYLFPGTKARASVFASGQPSNDEVAVVLDRNFKFKTVLTPAAFEVLIGGTAADTIANLIAAINDSDQNPSVGIDAVLDNVSTVTMHLFGNSVGAKPNGEVVDFSAVTNMSASTNMVGGREKDVIVREPISYTVTANDVLANNIRLRTAHAAPVIYSVLWFNAAGLQRHDIDSTVSTVDSDVAIVFSGAADPVAGDILRLVVEAA